MLPGDWLLISGIVTVVLLMLFPRAYHVIPLPLVAWVFITTDIPPGFLFLHYPLAPALGVAAGVACLLFLAGFLLCCRRRRQHWQWQRPGRQAAGAGWSDYSCDSARGFDDAGTACRILGLDRGASQREIKAAYRLAAKTYHPDVGGDAAEFRLATAAYEILTEKATRERSWR